MNLNSTAHFILRKFNFMEFSNNVYQRFIELCYVLMITIFSTWSSFPHVACSLFQFEIWFSTLGPRIVNRSVLLKVFNYGNH
jgi:hypothetical protein